MKKLLILLVLLMGCGVGGESLIETVEKGVYDVSYRTFRKGFLEGAAYIIETPAKLLTVEIIENQATSEAEKFVKELKERRKNRLKREKTPKIMEWLKL